MSYPIPVPPSYLDVLLSSVFPQGYTKVAQVSDVVVCLNPARSYGFGESTIVGELGGLWFADCPRELYDYDGVTSLSLAYAAAIEALGYAIPSGCVSSGLHKDAQKAGGYVALAKSIGLDVEVRSA